MLLAQRLHHLGRLRIRTAEKPRYDDAPLSEIPYQSQIRSDESLKDPFERRRIASRRDFHLLKHLEPLAVDWDDDPAQYGPEQVLLRPEVVVDCCQVYPSLLGYCP